MVKMPIEHGGTVKAFVVSDPEAGSIRSVEADKPLTGPDELLVRLCAVGVGIHDSYFLPPNAGPLFPIGIEGAGIVAEVGAGVADYRIGDRIAFVSSMQPKGGTWAEYAIVDSRSLILPMPAELDFVRAAGLPVAGNTTLRAFSALGDLPDGASIFIAGGSGAIGTLALQVARRRGWRVGASASAHNHDFIRSLGAELTVDYHDHGWTDDIRGWMPAGVDAAIAVQPGTSSECLPAVRDGGIIITVSGDHVETERAVTVAMVDYQSDVSGDLQQMMSDVLSGALHLEIEHVYPFDEAAEALARVQTRHVRGKLALRLTDHHE